MKAIQHHPASLKRFVMKYFNRTWVQELKKQEGAPPLNFIYILYEFGYYIYKIKSVNNK